MGFDQILKCTIPNISHPATKVNKIDIRVTFNIYSIYNEILLEA
jgi:hypothetical protein